MINETDLDAFGYYEMQRESDMEYIGQFTEFDNYQAFTDQSAIYPEDQGLVYAALGLASEAGEFAGKVKKQIRDGTFSKEDAVAELGDVLWYCARAAVELEVFLSDVARDNVDKLTSRLERGVVKGSGDER